MCFEFKYCVLWCIILCNGCKKEKWAHQRNSGKRRHNGDSAVAASANAAAHLWVLIFFMCEWVPVCVCVCWKLYWLQYNLHTYTQAELTFGQLMSLFLLWLVVTSSKPAALTNNAYNWFIVWLFLWIFVSFVLQLSNCTCCSCSCCCCSTGFAWKTRPPPTPNRRAAAVHSVECYHTSKMDRKAELERKKAKLAALREEKDRRRREKEIKDMEEAAGRIGTGTGIDKDQRKSVNPYTYEYSIQKYINYNYTICLQRSRWDAFVARRCARFGSVVLAVFSQFANFG